MTAELVLAALNMAMRNAALPTSSIITIKVFDTRVIEFGRRNGRAASMDSVGEAYNNAMAESFFASLDRELTDQRSFQTKAEARMAVFTYIEGWHNPRRRHRCLAAYRL